MLDDHDFVIIEHSYDDGLGIDLYGLLPNDVLDFALDWIILQLLQAACMASVYRTSF